MLLRKDFWILLRILQNSFSASVAQLVEQRIRNAWVVGSSPIGSFKYSLYVSGMVACR